MKILVVEDETKTGSYLKQGLVEAGFVVDLAVNGLDGLHLALTEAYDLAILDVMLPGIDGWQVLQGIRRAGKEMPVLFLTARDQVEDRVKGLELGADDYLVKPFAFSELLARVRTLLRRGGKAKESEFLRAADFELDLLRRLALYPRIVEAAAQAHEPHRIAFYLYELASEFHALWTRGRDLPHLRFIINNDALITKARLALVQGAVSVLASGLAVLGVDAPTEMR